VEAVEALVRWRHPELGLVAPAHFISLAEESGLIVPLGEWVLREACRQNEAWQRAGLPRLRVAVNVSGLQFERERLIPAVTRALRESGLQPGWLELEVTESTIMRDSPATLAILDQIKALGLRLAVDDFGTGYSSLSYLRRFPLDALKIDRSFVRDVVTSPDGAAITSAIIAMAKSLNLSVVAEGVETEDQAASLLEKGCRVMQGYLFSRPLPADALASWLHERDHSKRASMECELEPAQAAGEPAP
jgi:EAL domain-containing protein (putative c-di-GMP-specific phosphodiesterase class I)